MTLASLTGGRATDEGWRRRGFTDVYGGALRHLPARVGWAAGGRPGEATGLGQLCGLLPTVDGLVYAVSYGARRWLVRDEIKDQRFTLRFASGPHADQYWPSQTVQTALRPSACSS